MDYTRYVYLTALKICCPLISRYRYVTKLHNCQEFRSTAVLGLRCSESYNNLYTMTYFISANIEWLYLPGIMQICTSYNGSHIIYSLEIIEYRVSRCLQMQCASRCSHKCDKRGNICVRVFRTAPLSSFIFSFRNIVRVRLHSYLFKWQRGFMGSTLKQIYSSIHPLLRYKLCLLSSVYSGQVESYNMRMIHDVCLHLPTSVLTIPAPNLYFLSISSVTILPSDGIAFYGTGSPSGTMLIAKLHMFYDFCGFHGLWLHFGVMIMSFKAADGILPKSLTLRLSSDTCLTFCAANVISIYLDLMK